MTTRQEDEEIRRAVEEDPYTNANTIRENLQLNVTVQTIRRRLREAGVQHSFPAKKDRLMDQHRVDRLDFARQYVGKNLEFWSRVVFTGEKMFTRTNHDRIPQCEPSNTG